MKHDFEHLPAHPPAPHPAARTRVSIPDLWEKAKGLFARMIERVGGEEALRQARRIGRTERSDILGWLVPVERLTCAALVARALTRLLMTPEGRKLMRETPKQPPWQAQTQPPKPGPGSVRSIRIPYPGWHTIARHVSPPPPPPVSPPQPARTRACAFRVLRWTAPETAPSFTAFRRPGIIDLFADAPIALRPPSRSGDAKRSAARSARPHALARRIEALSRALANPEPIVRRLARFLASCPGDLLQAAANAPAPGDWRHGAAEFAAARTHVQGAVNALYRIEPG